MIFANPKRLDNILRPIFYGCCILFPILLILGLYFALIKSPPDYQQKDCVRIMYVHVPSSWMALMIYTNMAILNFCGLIWRHLSAFILAYAAALIGCAFTLISIITGAIWGKPMWGAWWVWDARLTSVFILFLLYIGYISLTQNFQDQDRGLRAGAVLNLIGIINLPIIKWSVNWWNTLHQSATITKLSKPSMPSEMMIPLFLMFGAAFTFFIIIWYLRFKTMVFERTIQTKRYKRYNSELDTKQPI